VDNQESEEEDSSDVARVFEKWCFVERRERRERKEGKGGEGCEWVREW